jgi:hypothetical protein
MSRAGEMECLGIKEHKDFKGRKASKEIPEQTAALVQRDFKGHLGIKVFKEELDLTDRWETKECKETQALLVLPGFKDQPDTTELHAKDHMRIGTPRYNIFRPKVQTVATATTITINAGMVRLTGTTQVRGINGGVAGQLLTIMATSNGTPINNPGGGNIRLIGMENGSNVCTLNANDSMQLVFDGTWWLEVGRKSSQGAQGSQGPQGDQGDQGFVGSQGSQGDQGMVGYQGDAGLFGDNGTPGNQGSQGPQGYDGPIGSQGAPGPDGPQGAPG